MYAARIAPFYTEKRKELVTSSTQADAKPEVKIIKEKVVEAAALPPLKPKPKPKRKRVRKCRDCGMLKRDCICCPACKDGSVKLAEKT